MGKFFTKMCQYRKMKSGQFREALGKTLSPKPGFKKTESVEKGRSFIERKIHVRLALRHEHAVLLGKVYFSLGSVARIPISK